MCKPTVLANAIIHNDTKFSYQTTLPWKMQMEETGLIQGQLKNISTNCCMRKILDILTAH